MLTELSRAYPDTRVQARHLSTAAQLEALHADELDVGLTRERPAGPEFDAMLVVRENLGVLLAADQAAELAGPDGVRLECLAGLEWVGFPRAGSPVWWDELTSVLRSHGLDVGPEAGAGEPLIAEVKLAAVITGRAFALAPPNWAQPIPETVVWSPLVGDPWSAGPGRCGRPVRTAVTSGISSRPSPSRCRLRRWGYGVGAEARCRCRAAFALLPQRSMEHHLRGFPLPGSR